MQRFPVTSLAPGQVVALPVYHTRRHDQILMRPGVALTTGAIDRLAEMDIRWVWIDTPGFESVGNYVSAHAIQARAGLIAELSEQFAEIERNPKARVRLDPFREAVVSMIEKLMVTPEIGVWAHDPELPGQPLLRNAVFVGSVSLFLGRVLDWYLIRERPKLPPSSASDIRGLGLAGLLHDVGMLRLEPHVLENWWQTHDESDVRWRQHVRAAYDMIRADVEPSTAAAILNHHQRCDGTGFPLRVSDPGGLQGSPQTRVHVFARIIAAADVLDHLRFPPGQDRPEPTVRVLRRMLGDPYRSALDPMVVHALMRVVPPFPPGARVTLSDGRTGVVVGLNPSAPCRPVVTLHAARSSEEDEESATSPVANADREEVESTPADGPGELKTIDLDTHPDLMIAKVDDQDVMMDNFTLSVPRDDAAHTTADSAAA